MYNNRASNYDASTGGCHAEIGYDFVKWVAPTPAAGVLDLACVCYRLFKMLIRVARRNRSLDHDRVSILYWAGNLPTEQRHKFCDYRFPPATGPSRHRNPDMY
jgi:hypothetical protein